MISFKDFEDEAGNVDWDAYEKAQIDAGERCTTCGVHMLSYGICGTNSGIAGPRECHSCQQRNDPEEFRHDKFIRCPNCGHIWNPFDTEDYHVLSEEEHDVWCGNCDHEFSVSTHVSYSFTSPVMYDEDDAE